MTLDTNGYYALGAPLYVFIVAIELFITRRKRIRAFRFADSIGNLSGGLGEVLIGLFIGPLLIALYELGYQRIALVHWSEGSLLSWVVAFFVSDFCYYWYHRTGHSVAALWAIHGVHHQSEEFNVTVAMRHPWFSDFYSAIFYIPLPLLGIPTSQFFIAISAISFYALTIHSRVFHRPSFYIFTTPATHILHHATNRRYIGKNLGAMFTLWDRMFGTYVEAESNDPPVLGTRAGYQTHDGARSQWIFFRPLFQAARSAASWRDALRVFISRPGWLPPGVSLNRPDHARADEAIPAAIKCYSAFQFIATLLFALYVLWTQERHGFAILAAASAMTMWSISTIGGLLDDRRRCVEREMLRLTGTVLFGVSLIASPGYDIAALCLVTVGVCGGIWLTIIRRNLPSPANNRENMAVSNDANSS